MQRRLEYPRAWYAGWLGVSRARQRALSAADRRDPGRKSEKFGEVSAIQGKVADHVAWNGLAYLRRSRVQQGHVRDMNGFRNGRQQQGDVDAQLLSRSQLDVRDRADHEAGASNREAVSARL